MDMTSTRYLACDCLIFVYVLFLLRPIFSFFFFNDTATTEIYTLSLHDALPISVERHGDVKSLRARRLEPALETELAQERSEEHTSELQSQSNLVCRLLLEKKKKKRDMHHSLLSADMTDVRV